MNNKELAVRGEMAAAKHLEGLGYKVIDKNVLFNGGEIDIIATDKSAIVFVEVKTRNSTSYGLPVESITRAKQKAIVHAAKLYLIKKGWVGRDVRFDVISILRDEIEHIQDAFWAN